MPKKSEDWDKLETPTTPSQINHFFDLCTKWLVGDVLNSKEVFSKHLNKWTENSLIIHTATGLTEEVLNMNCTFQCHFCKKTEDIKSFVGNPYARKYVITVCSTCVPY